jgi:hypothetical protein
MNKIKSFFTQVIISSYIGFNKFLFLNIGKYDSYFLFELKLLILKLNSNSTFDKALFLAKAQNIIYNANPNEKDALNYNADKLARIKDQFIEIINDQPIILIKYLEQTELENIDVVKFSSLITSTKLPLSLKTKELTPEQKNRIIEQTKEWWLVNKSSYDRLDIILISGLLCDLEIIEIEGKDNKKNRLVAIRKEITKDAYDDPLLKRVQYEKNEKKILKKHYNNAIKFFSLINFEIGLEFITNKLQQID